MKIKLLTIILIVIGSISSAADMNTELETMFTNMGFSASPTGPGHYEGQTRGFYTGGAVAVRAPYENINPVSISLPSVSAGCGGIDFHLGAMSYINGDKIVQKLRAIGQNATGYVFQLALATVSPEIKSIITEFENISNMINQINMDSCTAAKGMVDFGRRKFAETIQDSCTDYTARGGGSNDRVDGGELCRTNNSGMLGGLNGEEKKTYSPFKNYTYDAFKNIQEVKDNIGLIESLMSTMGTVILKDNGGSVERVYIPPTITFENLINGGNTTVLSCPSGLSSDCLDIVSNPVVLSGFKSYVEEEMLDIAAAIAANSDLTNSQKSFVQSSAIPIYKIMNVLSVYPYVSTSFIKRFSESIAITLAYYWIEESFTSVLRGIRNVEDTSGMMKEYLETERTVRDDANLAMSRAQNQLNSIDIMIREVQRIEETITKSLSEGINRGYTYASLGGN